MRHSAIAAGLVAASLAAGAPVLAQPPYHHHHHHHYRHYAAYRHEDYARCEADRRNSANTGTLLGGVAGAVAGNAIGGGHLGGTLIGGGVGAVAGHEIANHGRHC